MMFSATFLGHQGWLFQGGRSRLLLDPLFEERFGHDGSLGVMFPPREFNVDKVPAVDAVFLTHEHEDHFNIPTLARLSRDIPVYLSSRSSTVARRLIERMGFEVRLADAGEKLEIGDLELYTLSPNHVDDDNSDEWDVLPFFVQDKDRNGCLFSGVDVVPTEEMERHMECVTGTPGLWCYTNNANDWRFMFAGKVIDRFPRDDTFSMAEQVIRHQARIRFSWRKPEASLFLGGGYSFVGDRSWMNRHVFMASTERVVAALSALCPEERVHALQPGQTFTMAAGKLVNVAEHTDFLRCVPRHTWPDRNYAPTVQLVDAYDPLVGSEGLSPGQRQQLHAELARFAEYLYTTISYKQLYSLLKQETQGRQPTFALVLLSDAGPEVLAYEPQSCSFVPSDSDDPVNDYIAGIECWARDLHAVLTGEVGSSGLIFGRSRKWNWLPEHFHLTIAELWRYVHPLRRPDLFERLYANLLEQASDRHPVVGHNRFEKMRCA
jgi:hypothetical protein